jgi:hypothetical protein
MLRKKSFLLILASMCLLTQSFAQNFTASFVKTVTTQSTLDKEQTSIFPLGSAFLFSFDDLESDQKTYYYKIEHCNYDWEVSNLNPSEYIEGTNELEIFNFENSFNTLQGYTHYSFQIPNQNTRIKISGHFLVTIYNEYDEICIQRRIVLHENLVNISTKVVRDRNLENINTKQVVHFSIYHPSLRINNPRQELRVVILQNQDWNFSKKNLQPQFYKKNEMVYNYNDITSFSGGNEFLNFDTKDINGNHVSIAQTALDSIFHHFLYPTQPRINTPYTLAPDINGGFVIRTINENNVHTEGDYSWVHFTLKNNLSELSQKELYVYGAFNNYALTEDNKMTYDKDRQVFEASLLLKQGFYNYCFANQNNVLEKSNVDGSFFTTENEYTILVYYHPFGQRIGKIIGAHSVFSKNF